MLQSCVIAFRTPVSLVRFECVNHGIAAISRDFRSNIEEFLCTADCMAEREGFEPSVQVLARTTV
jgi:hypothetical protein